MLEVFMAEIEAQTNPEKYLIESVKISHIPDGLNKLKQEAHKSWIEMYNHADLTPTQAQELARIYVSLYLAQEEYLRLNREFSKYTAK